MSTSRSQPVTVHRCAACVSDSITDSDGRDAVADLGDDADSFVTRDQRHGGLDMPFAPCRVDVGVAESNVTGRSLDVMA